VVSEEEPLFRELDHTADIAIEVVADSPAELFRRAGLALHSFLVEADGIESREERRLDVESTGWADLLHDWLARLLRDFLVQGFVAREIAVDEISDRRIASRISGETLDHDRHQFIGEIKAVTYHELVVEERDGRWRAHLIFDV
jgi:SHS2 domain-containing protein